MRNILALIFTIFVLHSQQVMSIDCPSFCHLVADTGIQSDLAEGYFLFRKANKGIYKSPIQVSEPQIIPGTENDFDTRCIEISDDALWVVYVRMDNHGVFLIRNDGQFKTEVPIKQEGDYLTADIGFVRNSPYGTEIYYAASDTIIRAIKVFLFENEQPCFGGTRVLCDLKDQYKLLRNFGYGVTRDQIFGVFSPVVDGVPYHSVGYLTIPDSGKGIGGPKNVYKWARDSMSELGGCYHTMSHDGLYCIGNAGRMGGSCVPKAHHGFYVTRFRRDTDPPLNPDQSLDLYATSLNFCPKQYQVGNNDFHCWNIGNKNNYVIGCQSGTDAPCNAIWIIDWTTNKWTPLVQFPQASGIITASYPSYFFSTDKVSISIQQSSMGTVFPTGTRDIYINAPFFARANANKGYHFVSWEINGNARIIGNITSDTIEIMPKSNVTITPVFAADPLFHLGITADSHGTITSDTAFQVSVRDSVIITARPDPGYLFSGWVVEDGSDTILTHQSSCTTKVHSVNCNTTIKATFALTIGTLTIEKQGKGLTVPQGTLLIGHSNPTLLKAYPDSGYRFNHWANVQGVAVFDDTSAAVTQVTIPSGNAVIKADFEPLTYRVRIQPSLKGMIKPAGDTMCGFNDTIMLSATPFSGYVFNGWQVDSGNSSILNANDTVTSMVVKSNTLISARIVSQDPLNPHYRVIRPNGGEKFVVGQSCTVVVTSDINATAMILLQFGKYQFQLTLDNPVNPRIDSIYIFTIPSYFNYKYFNTQTGMNVDTQISSVASDCRIVIKDYQYSYKDVSDSNFCILPINSIIEESRIPESFQFSCHSLRKGFVLNYAIPQYAGTHNVTFSIIDLKGRLVWARTKKLVQSGQYYFERVDPAEVSLTKGIFLCRMKTNMFSRVVKLITH